MVHINVSKEIRPTLRYIKIYNSLGFNTQAAIINFSLTFHLCYNSKS